ncbi:MAG: polymer-forming cytoskeletal protein [Alphaproteobacteria bacterium]|nr:polymer-forming cytoskeletal protein [Alphaproteobacteria bacterium]
MRNLRKLICLKLAAIGKNSKALVPSIISYDTKIKGDIWGGETVQIDGRIEGNIMCSEVIVGVHGYVAGDIKAKSLSVYGTVNGTIDTEELFVAKDARLIGNTCYTQIALAPGAYVEGTCVPRSKLTAATVKSIPTAENENKQETELKAVK